MPQPDADDEFFEEEEVAVETKPKPKPAPTPKPKPETSKFHVRLLRDAEGLGIPQDEIDSCSNNSELMSIIKYEQDKVDAEARRSAIRHQPERGTKPEPETPAPEADEEWADPADDDDYKDIHPSIKKEIKRLGNELIKATKKGKKSRIDQLEEEIAELKREREQAAAANHPDVKLAKRIIGTYPDLFGTEEDRAENPGSREAANFNMVVHYVTKVMRSQGKATGNLAKDIPAAIGILFPGSKPAGTEAQPGSGEPKPRPRTRVEEWDDAGSHPATHRNGASRSGRPGNRAAAVKKAKEKMRDLGHVVVDDDDDLDGEEDI